LTEFRRVNGIAGPSIFLAALVIILVGAGIAYFSLSSGSGQASTGQNTTLGITTTLSNSTTGAQGTSSQSSSTIADNGTETSTEQAATGPLQIPVSSASASNSSIDLRLDLNLVGFPNGTLRISADEYNTQNTIVNISAAADWPYSQTTLQSYNGSCSNAILPLGIAVFQGYFVSSDLPSAQAATIYDGSSAGTSCTTSGNSTATTPTQFVFYSLGDSAAVYTSKGFMGNYNVQLSVWTSGSWTSSASTMTFNPFPNGNYTVMAGDEWGQLVLLHFGVVHSSSPQTSAFPINLGASPHHRIVHNETSPDSAHPIVHLGSDKTINQHQALHHIEVPHN
jgi:hypothetical protein